MVQIMATISLCMIVKDEEQVLSRCLESIADLMDEIVIVDTGSLDKTKEIARRYTDKIYDYVWKDDFADARNYSFSKATMEYIYCADADEVLDEKNRERFRLLKQALTDEIEIVQMYYCNQMQYNTVYNYDKEYRPKLYKRVRKFTFIDPIHEVVRTEPVVFDSEIEIMHLPVSEHGERDFRGFEKMVREGRHVSKRLHNMYAKELHMVGTKEDVLRAQPFFEQTAKDEDRSMDEVLEAICIVARGARLSGDFDTFFKYALKGVACEGCSEICCELGDYYFDKKDYEEAALWYSNAAFDTECILNIQCKERYSIEKLIACYKAVGNIQAAEELERQLGGKQMQSIF